MMEYLFGLLAFYFVVSAIIEAAIMGLERLTWGTWSPIYKAKHGSYMRKEEFISRIWSPVSKWLMVILSGLVVWKTGVYFIGILGINALQMPEGFSIGVLDPILTTLLISRGSNAVHELMEMLKNKNGDGGSE